MFGTFFMPREGKGYLDMVAMSVIHFYTDYDFCGNTYRSMWCSVNRSREPLLHTPVFLELLAQDVEKLDLVCSRSLMY